VERLSGKPVELGPGVAQGVGGLAEHGSGSPTWSCGLAGPDGWGPKGLGSWWGMDLA
jgi:hypothetical protein